MTDDNRLLATLVDDNLMFTMRVEPALRALGYRVRTLAGGPAAAGAIEQAAPALVLVNLAANRSPGADLVRALRALPAVERTPVLGYAGHVERHLFQAGRDAGCDLVVPNSAITSALPEVLRKLERRLAGEETGDEQDED